MQEKIELSNKLRGREKKLPSFFQQSGVDGAVLCDWNGRRMPKGLSLILTLDRILKHGLTNHSFDYVHSDCFAFMNSGIRRSLYASNNVRNELSSENDVHGKSLDFIFSR